VSSALRNSPSARWVIAANEICRFFDIFGKNIVFWGHLLDIRRYLDNYVNSV
jgi:hypothetical protein